MRAVGWLIVGWLALLPGAALASAPDCDRTCLEGFVDRYLEAVGRKDIQVVAINDLGPVETNAHLLRYDSVHGRFPRDVKIHDEAKLWDIGDVIVDIAKARGVSGAQVALSWLLGRPSEQ